MRRKHERSLAAILVAVCMLIPSLLLWAGCKASRSSVSENKVHRTETTDSVGVTATASSDVSISDSDSIDTTVEHESDWTLTFEWDAAGQLRKLSGTERSKTREHQAHNKRSRYANNSASAASGVTSSVSEDKKTDTKKTTTVKARLSVEELIGVFMLAALLLLIVPTLIYDLWKRYKTK